MQLHTYPSLLNGAYQEANKKTVQQSLAVLQDLAEVQVNKEQIRAGFKNVIENTGLQGRWQILGLQPKIIADTAHNAHGLRLVMQQLMELPKDQLHIVLGVVNDKDLKRILPLFPKNATYYFCKPAIPRGLDAAILQVEAAAYGLKGAVYNSVSEAYQKAVVQAGIKDVIYIGGSTFVVAELF